MIKISIDLRLIDQSRCNKKTRANGQAATFCDLVLFETPNDTYGNDYRVTQDFGKDARAAGEKGPIVGNGKILGQKPKPQERQQQRSAPPAKKPPVDPDLDAAEESYRF